MCSRVCSLFRASHIYTPQPRANKTSDYKDDGTNILLDANENAYGPGLALNSNGTLSNGDTEEIDLLGLNRYPDPYVPLTM